MTYPAPVLTQLDNMPTGVSELTYSAASLDGRVYVAGGLSSSGVTNVLQEWDPTASPTWRYRTAMPTALREVALCGHGGYLYAAGGYTGTTTVDTFRRWDPVADSWAALAPLPATRMGGALLSDGEHLFYLAGESTSIWASLFRYDTTADAWTTLTPSPQDTTKAWIALLDGYIYQWGGYLRPQTGYRYSIATDTWDSSIASAPSSTYFQPAVAAHDRIVLFSGTTLYHWKPGDASWTSLTTSSIDARQGSAASIGGIVYVAGGTNAITSRFYKIDLGVDVTPPEPVVIEPHPVGIVLQWTKPADADYVGAMIRRADGAMAPTGITDGSLVGVVTAAQDSFVDTDVISGQQYSYAVFAYDSSANYAGAATITATAGEVTPAAPPKTTGQIWPRGKR